MEIAAEGKQYRLRQMVLINAGTNKSTASGRIVSIDPRGGAAVTGANGVGKTTTLSLLPLFLGLLPTRLMANGSTKAGMLKFILPDATSAIAYEYQRGDEQDLRLAVLRRRDDDERASSYRIYRCGFDQQLFVKDQLFLSDLETQEVANALGIAGTRPLSSSDYRSIILRSSYLLKDKRLRDYRLEHSFSPIPMDNMDVLMGAMLKDKLSLDEIAQVAIARVQQSTGQGARGKLAFRQKTAQIDDWLSLRRACEDALAQGPKVAEQRAAIEEHARIESLLRAAWWNATHLQTLKSAAQKESRKELEDLQAQHKLDLDADEVRRSELDTAAGQTASAASEAKNASDQLEQTWARFQMKDAQGWKNKLREEAGLQAALEGLTGKISAATATMDQVVQRYADLKNNEAKSAEAVIEGLREEKGVPQDDYDTALGSIAKAEEDALSEAEQAFKDADGPLRAQLEPLVEQRGGWIGAAKAPQAGSQLVLAVKAAEDGLYGQSQALVKAQDELSSAKEVQASARVAFDAQEALVRQARTGLATAELDLARVEAVANPEDGTVLHALRRHPDEKWKADLAKVLDPALLSRSDLAPEFLDAEAPTMFGWAIQLDVLAQPSWADDAATRDAVAEARATVTRAAAMVQTAVDGLGQPGEVLRKAESSLSLAQGGVNILVAQAEPLAAALTKARLELDRGKEAARLQAEQKAEELKGRIEEVNRQLEALAQGLDARKKAIAGEHKDLRTKAHAARGSALQQIDRAIGDAQKALETRLKELDQQRDAHLANEGVDVAHLEAMRSKAQEIRGQLREMEDHKPLVAAWNDFQAAGGETQVVTAKSTAAAAAAKALECNKALRAHDEIVRARARAHQQVVLKLGERISGLDAELASLGHLLASFDIKPAYVEPTAVLTDGVDALKVQVEDLRIEIDAVLRGIRARHGQLGSTLRATNKQMAKFADDWLSQDFGHPRSELGEAMALCQCYGQIPAEVVRPNNLELRTIVTSIGALSDALQGFKTEIDRVNRQIQEGLSRVTCFERIKDLTLSIETNFENLGFYKKLRGMTESIRDYVQSPAYLDDRELAPRAIAAALGDFASVLGRDGSLEINLGDNISVAGSVSDNGKIKQFKCQSELEAISSNGLTSLIMITLMCALVNTMRGNEPVYLPWLTDEVAAFDKPNLTALLGMLAANRIDIVTASPALDLMQRGLFARRYLFEDYGRVRQYQAAPAAVKGPVAVTAGDSAGVTETTGAPA